MGSIIVQLRAKLEFMEQLYKFTAQLQNLEQNCKAYKANKVESTIVMFTTVVYITTVRLKANCKAYRELG